MLDDTNVPLYSCGTPGKYEFNLTYSISIPLYDSILFLEGVLDDTNVPLYSGGPPGKYEFNLTYSTLCMIILLCCVV